MDKQTRNKWLIGHGYITINDGQECLSLDAFALVGNTTPERFRQGFHYNPDTNESHMDDDLKQDLKRGAQELMAQYGTTDMYDILYQQAQQHEADKEKL